MRIGIIGAGFVGQAIAKLAAANGHEVMISNSRGPDTLFSVRGALGCAAGTAEEAAVFGDLAVVAVPLKAYRSIPVLPLAGKIVIDTNNYYPERDGTIEELDRQQTTTSELLAAHLRQSRVVKAFNAIVMADLSKDGRPSGATDRRALPIAGDDADAKALVARLYEEFGFDVADAGPLSEGWRFERARPAYCMWLNRAELERMLAATTRDAFVEEGAWRKQGMEVLP
ncbi:NADPH-dependent F420 reductase [Pannonibacter sp. Q-1]|uniref:NADPH-dependent F420 reductase n=1 Tax=Pannonibacter TaxID=227873 RepID=UPI000F041B56|nr:NAD(P)-binding domain-containing protein [Pannonibacter phragmitetus]